MTIALVLGALLAGAQPASADDPLTEALKRLENEGLLKTVPRIGARITIPSPTDVRGILDVREALECLDKDRAFLKNGGVFDDDFIDSYIELKMTEVARFEMTPHPVEFEMYYSL